MTQTTINRRTALAVVAAVPAAVALGSTIILAGRGDDKLSRVISRYRAEIAALNATRGLSDEELDARIDRADAILIEAVGLPVCTTADAVAVFSLFVDEHWNLRQHSVYGDQFLTLARTAIDHIASTA